MKKCYVLMLLCLAGLTVISNCGYAEPNESKTTAEKTFEQRLSELEQRLLALENQLLIERRKSEQTQAALEKSEAELDSLKKVRFSNTGDTTSPEQVRQMIDTQLDARKDELAVPEWVRNMQIAGDLRYRFEQTYDNSKSYDRNRNRIRARVGLYGKSGDEFDYGFRIATGNDEAPTATNQDLGDSFSKKQLWLDLAYIDYHPRFLPGSNIIGGKIKNPYYAVGTGDLLFDKDVNPEGIAVKYSHRFNGTTDIFAVAGGYCLEERNTEAETSLWGFQAGIRHAFDKDKKTNLVLGAGYYDYGNLKGTTLSFDAGNFFGNTSSGGTFASDFTIVQGFAEFGFEYDKLPVKLFFDYANNIRCNTGSDTAWLTGFTVGRNKKPGDWQLGYSYRTVEADSIVGVLAERTFGGGGTDVKGHTLGIGYRVSEDVNLSAAYIKAHRTRNGTTYEHDVVLTDLVLKF